MRVHLYTPSWNDLPQLEFFFRHYEPWVERFFIFDDGSDDGTREYLEKHPRVTLASLTRSDPQSWVESARVFYDTAWRASRGVADWVVLTNIDEHLYQPNITVYLERCRAAGVTVIPALGYQMFAQSFPLPESVLWRDVRYGAPNEKMSKVGIFDPNAIEQVRYKPGRHGAAFQGRIILPDRDELLNLHYKYLGIDYVFPRHQEESARLLGKDKQKGWGRHYLWSRETLQQDMDQVAQASFVVIDPARDHHATHPGKRWWREPTGIDFDSVAKAAIAKALKKKGKKPVAKGLSFGPRRWSRLLFGRLLDTLRP